MNKKNKKKKIVSLIIKPKLNIKLTINSNKEILPLKTVHLELKTSLNQD